MMKNPAKIIEDKIEVRFLNTSRSKTFSNIVREYNLSNKRVLDLGCSYGEFLVHFGKGSVGVTISADEALYGKNKGLDLRLGNAEDELPFEQEFDVIFANNLFEHLYSPHKFLCDIKKYLKPGGILILGVPCIPIIYPLVHLRKFRGSLADSHINFFNKETLQKVVERAGWTVINVRGFHFFNVFVDKMLNLVYPHFYVVASVNPDFSYSEKRIKELKGYH